MAELADALDLGSSLIEVGVQVSSVAPKEKALVKGAFFLLFIAKRIFECYNQIIQFTSWARGSVGRAFGSHPRGRGFDSLRVHQNHF